MLKREIQKFQEKLTLSLFIQRIDYVGGFEANGFAYFATRQPKYTPQPDAQPTISKVISFIIRCIFFHSSFCILFLIAS
jgi:hypothetical protein